MMNINIATISALVLGLVLSSCGGGGSDQKSSSETEQTRQKSEKKEKKDVPETVELTIEGNDQMKYNKERLEVHEGQEVTVTLKHVGEMNIEEMGHNFILLKKGVDKQEFAADGVDAGVENNHIAEDRKDDVIAHTELVGGGEETSVTFTAPKAGIYEFICSFPGHVGMMNGKFIVK